MSTGAALNEKEYHMNCTCDDLDIGHDYDSLVWEASGDEICAGRGRLYVWIEEMRV